MQMSSAAWIAIGVGAVGVAMALFILTRPRIGGADLGSVSEHWIADHRVGPDPHG
jgi:hypothetical protein